MRLVKYRDLANERGTLCDDAIFDRITIQNPVKLFYCCRIHDIRLVFYVKNQDFWHVSNILQIYLTVPVLGLLFL
jgi:hypothetical protein